MRPFGEGKVAHHTKAYNQQFPHGRYDRHWLKDKALTRGGLINHVMVMMRSQQNHSRRGYHRCNGINRKNRMGSLRASGWATIPTQEVTRRRRNGKRFKQM